MKNRFSFQLIIVLFLLGFTFDGALAQGKQEYQNLRQALFSGVQLSGERGPQNVQWIDGGDRYSYMQRNFQTGSNEIRVYDPSDRTDVLIFDTVEHTFPGSSDPFAFRSFEWSADFQYIVFQTDFSPIYRYSGISNYFYYSIEEQTLELIAEDAFTAQLSPDGTKVGYHRNGDMFVFDLATGEETQLTNSAKEHFFNGRFGWVYEEEFGLVQAWKWSHDSRYIAYWQTDEGDVKRFVSTDYEGRYPTYTDIPYPKVGDTNPTVKIGVLDVESSENQWMRFNQNDGLIPRIYWTSNEQELAVVWMNRQQSELKLTFFDVLSGEGRVVMEESNEDGWIDVYDFFAGIDDYFFFSKDRDEFLWVSDRDGYNHLYRYNYDGDLLNKVTEGNWRVTNVFAVNSEENRIYYESTEESPLERHLYSITFGGDDKIRYTQEPGSHSFSMGPDGRYYIDTWSNTETPTQVELWTTDGEGEKLETFVTNESVTSFTEKFVYQPRELFTFTTSDEQELDGYMIKPHDFDSTKTYPLLLSIYGGPSSQGVYNQFETSMWTQYLAQEGYVIANVNNRGNGGYSADFEKSVYKNLGELEAFDFAETAKYLASKEWIDGDRMAIRGHSYGGYMAALTAVLHPDVFSVSIVGAPVTDWRLYDSVYTERYMDLLEENEQNYINGSVMAHAGNLEANMLVVHSSMDENVHIQNTMQMLTAFTNAGKDVDLRIYPPGAHGVSYNQPSYLLLYQTYTDYLNRFLK